MSTFFTLISGNHFHQGMHRFLRLQLCIYQWVDALYGLFVTWNYYVGFLYTSPNQSTCTCTIVHVVENNCLANATVPTQRCFSVLIFIENDKMNSKYLMVFIFRTLRRKAANIIFTIQHYFIINIKLHVWC